MFDRFTDSRTHHRDPRVKSLFRVQIKRTGSQEFLATLHWPRKMKALGLLYFSPILLLSLVESCCDQPSSGLKRKWELWTHPILRKRAVEIAQKRLLSILGLDNFPKPGRHVIPHKYMLEIYRNLSNGDYKRASNTGVLPNTVVGIVDQG